MLSTTKKRTSSGCWEILIRIYMVIEYVENGQIMYYDPNTLRFYSKRTGRFSLRTLI